MNVKHGLARGDGKGTSGITEEEKALIEEHDIAVFALPAAGVKNVLDTVINSGIKGITVGLVITRMTTITAK